MLFMVKPHKITRSGALTNLFIVATPEKVSFSYFILVVTYEVDPKMRKVIK